MVKRYEADGVARAGNHPILPGRKRGHALRPIEFLQGRRDLSHQPNPGPTRWTLLSSEMTMPGGIKVFTNATFQVKDGKARHLEAGQILRPDGNLLNPDGSTMPVFDHLAMSGATVKVFKDGKGQALTDTLILPDGTSINPDGPMPALTGAAPAWWMASS